MSLLSDFITDDTSTDITDPNYQANLYLIESAMRELGHKDQPAYQPSAYDNELLKLIDSVPLE